MHHVQIIGEACRGLSSEFRDKYPDFPWSKIVGMRNILARQYFGIDKDVVWAVVDRDLPDLQTKIETILPGL